MKNVIDTITDIYIDTWNHLLHVADLGLYYIGVMLLTITSPIWVWFNIHRRIAERKVEEEAMKKVQKHLADRIYSSLEDTFKPLADAFSEIFKYEVDDND